MIITILTLFPEIFPPILNTSIIGRAQKKSLVNIRCINIRDYALDRHKSVDNKPYGGGVGMIMRVDVVERAITKAKSIHLPGGVAPAAHLEGVREKVVLLDPKGKIFTQATVLRYSKLDHLILVCGHYEGIDARISHFVDETISIGKYVLTGGEIPAMVITDTVTRLINGVLTKKEATTNESFSIKDMLEYPQYTRPPKFKNYQVPEILLSGNHQRISEWRNKKIKEKSINSLSK